MSPGNERDIRQLISGALDTVTPSPAPAGTVLRKGKALRTRRRAGIAVGVAAGLAVVAAAIVVIPGLAHQRGNQPPVPQRSPRSRSRSAMATGSGSGQ